MGRIIVAAFLLLAAPTAFADTLTGKVVKVADGDSISVLDSTNTQHRIRLQGIDAPERKQAFGNASRKHLATLVAGKTVTVKWVKRDRYGRIVGFVIVDGHDMNLVQVKAGMAWFYRYYQKELSRENRKLYAQVEDQARSERRGLWQDKSPMPPWEWRRLNRHDCGNRRGTIKGHYLCDTSLALSVLNSQTQPSFS